MLMLVVNQPGVGTTYRPLPIQSMAFDCTVQISTAFCTVDFNTYFPREWPATAFEVVLPKSTHTTILEVTVENLVRDSVYATAVVPVEDVVKGGFKPAVSAAAANAGANMGSLDDGAQAGDDPELFRLAMPRPGQPGDMYRVRLSYFEPLEFQQGAYLATLPTTVPPMAVVPGSTASQVVRVQMTINTGSPVPVKHTVPSGHGVKLGHSAPGTQVLLLEPGPSSPASDFIGGYQMWGEDMFISLNVNPPGAAGAPQYDPRGTFVLTVAPPAPEYTQPYNRSVVFILDRSGSMDGEPMNFAKAAVSWGLTTLTPQDEFAVVAFDHEQMWFSPSLMAATPDNTGAATSWIASAVEARGLTDIMAPLQAALSVLQQARGLPFIFLITDGCVENERDIVQYINQYVSAQAPPGQPPPRGLPRLSTFAIGPYANHYFLKLLGTAGRGSFDVAFRPHSIEAQIKRMLVAAQKPVLSDITLSLPGIKSAELYPYPIPDLFCGMPLVIAGKYAGDWPPEVVVNGRLPSGQPWSSKPVAPAQQAGPPLPLDKVFIKARLDLLTGQAWLDNNNATAVGKVVELSVATGVPCAYTRTIGFECTRANYQAMQAQYAQGRSRKMDYALIALGGVAGIAIVAGAAAAFAFGDLGATIANAGVFEGIGGAFEGMGDAIGGAAAGVGEGCGDCGDCDNCDMGDAMGGADCTIS